MKAFRVFAYLLAVDVVIQGMAMGWGVSGLSKWVENGGVLTKAKLDDHSKFLFPEERGFMIHGLNGQIVIPLIVLILLIIAFAAKVPGGPKRAGILFGMVVVQIILGLSSHGVPALNTLHVLNAFGIFYMALDTAKTIGAKEPASA